MVRRHDSWSSHVAASDHLLVHVSPSGKVGRALLLVPRCAGEGGVRLCVEPGGRKRGAWRPVLWEMVKVGVCGIRIVVVGVGLGIGGALRDCGGRRGRGSQAVRARARARRPRGRRGAVEARAGKRSARRSLMIKGCGVVHGVTVDRGLHERCCHAVCKGRVSKMPRNAFARWAYNKEQKCVNLAGPRSH